MRDVRHVCISHEPKEVGCCEVGRYCEDRKCGLVACARITQWRAFIAIESDDSVPKQLCFDWLGLRHINGGDSDRRGPDIGGVRGDADMVGGVEHKKEREEKMRKE